MQTGTHLSIASDLHPTDAEPAFDQAAALAGVDGDQAFLCTLASIYVEDAPPLIAEIRAAIEQHDGGRLTRAAHRLKGGTYPFCARAVTDAAQTLESIGESGQMATALSELGRFEEAISRLLTALVALPLRTDGQTAPPPVARPEGTIPCTP